MAVEPEQLTREPINEFANDWSPDGDEILYQANRGSTRCDVMLASADGTRTEGVAVSNAEEQHGSWSPDGNSVAYSCAEKSNERFDVCVTSRPRKGGRWGAPRRLTTEGGIDPKWSPDERWIAYTRQGNVRLASPDGSNDHVLFARGSADSHSEAQYVIWSPDGQTIYIKATDRDRSATIWSMPAAGGTPRLLMRFDDPSRPSLRREFATDGQRFYFTIAQDESDIWVMELNQSNHFT
jgi:TolB protein